MVSWVSLKNSKRDIGDKIFFLDYVGISDIFWTIMWILGQWEAFSLCKKGEPVTLFYISHDYNWKKEEKKNKDFKKQ